MISVSMDAMRRPGIQRRRRGRYEHNAPPWSNPFPARGWLLDNAAGVAASKAFQEAQADAASKSAPTGTASSPSAASWTVGPAANTSIRKRLSRA